MGFASCFLPTPYSQKPSSTKESSPLKPETLNVLSSQEAPEDTVPWQTFALPLVLVLLLTSAVILLFALQRHSLCHSNPGLAFRDSKTSRGALEASEEGDSWVSLLPLLAGG